jgi:hypothetical protein
MKVGSVTETVTVSGESPIVDVQSTTRQRAGKEVTDTIPVGRSYESLTVLIPGMTAGAQDVGGTNNLRLTANLAIHGGRRDRRPLHGRRPHRSGILERPAPSPIYFRRGRTQEVAIDYAADRPS